MWYLVNNNTKNHLNLYCIARSSKCAVPVYESSSFSWNISILPICALLSLHVWDESAAKKSWQCQPDKKKLYWKWFRRHVCCAHQKMRHETTSFLILSVENHKRSDRRKTKNWFSTIALCVSKKVNDYG